MNEFSVAGPQRQRFTTMDAYCRCIRKCFEMYESLGCTRAGDARGKLAAALREESAHTYGPQLKTLVLIEMVMFSLWDFDPKVPAPDWSPDTSEPYTRTYFIETMQNIWPELFEGNVLKGE